VDVIGVVIPEPDCGRIGWGGIAGRADLPLRRGHGLPAKWITLRLALDILPDRLEERRVNSASDRTGVQTQLGPGRPVTSN